MESAKEQAIVSEDLIGPKARSGVGVGSRRGGHREETGATHCSAFTPSPVQPAVTTSLPVTVHFVPRSATATKWFSTCGDLSDILHIRHLHYDS